MRGMMNIKKQCHIIVVGIFLLTYVSAGDSSVTYADQNGPEQDSITIGLEECIMFSLKNSFDVKLAKLDLYISETHVLYSEAVFDTFLYGGAGYAKDKRQQNSVFAADDNQTNTYSAGVMKTLPTGTEVNVEVSDQRAWSNSAFVDKNPAHDAEFTMEATQPVGKNFFGYADRGRVSIARLAVKNSSLEMKDRIEVLIATVEKAYLNLIKTKRAVEIYNDMLDRAEKLYEADKRNYDVGRIEKVDLVASEANVANTKAEVRIVENNYARAEADLKLIMNMDAETHLIPEDNIDISGPGMDLTGCLKVAFEKRRDYLEDKRDVEMYGINLKIKKNMEWPEIDLNFTMAMNGLEEKFNKAAGKTTVADNTYYYAGVQVTIPLENSEARSESDKAKQEKEKSVVNLKKTEREIITDVGNAYGDVVAYKESLGYLKKTVDLQSTKLEEEEKRFSYGRSDTKRIIDYQRDLLRAELEHLVFLLKYNNSKVDLERAMNVILEKYEGLL